MPEFLCEQNWEKLNWTYTNFGLGKPVTLQVNHAELKRGTLTSFHPSKTSPSRLGATLLVGSEKLSKKTQKINWAKLDSFAWKKLLDCDLLETWHRVPSHLASQPRYILEIYAQDAPTSEFRSHLFGRNIIGWFWKILTTYRACIIANRFRAFKQV